MGAELGSLVTALLEREPWVGAIEGLDSDPPRRRLAKALFHRVDPFDEVKVARVVREFDPEVVVHFGVFEPDARASQANAARWNPALAISVLAAAAESPSLQSVVVRSGLEVYGRGGDRAEVPTETAPLAPTSPFGRQLAEIEARGRLLAEERGVPVALLRLAPVIGPHVPSPLGRLLRLQVVPVDLLGACRGRFSLIDSRDAAAAAVVAARTAADGAFNIAPDDAVTAMGALRQGRRLPVPVIGPQWIAARLASSALGAPVPAHVVELLAKGRRGDTARATELLGWSANRSTEQALEALYAWESVVHVRPTKPADLLRVEGV
jgi:UDP-glucose 4-epimerase